METLTSKPPLLGGAFRGLVWLGGAIATLAAGAVATALAVFFTAALAVVAMMGVALVGFAGLAIRARRTAKSGDPNVIEARNVGGARWVAYGWDRGGGKA